MFVAADRNSHRILAKALEKAYQSQEVRLEDVIWWYIGPKLARVYTTIVRIPHNRVGYLSFNNAISYMESLGKPYDILLLTHGYKNHLSTGSGYFFSYRELSLLKSQLSFLDLVFMAGCKSATLIEDWHQAGAKTVIAFADKHNHHFYIDMFLGAFNGDNPLEADNFVKQHKISYASNSPLLTFIMANTNIDPQLYMNGLLDPNISNR